MQYKHDYRWQFHIRFFKPLSIDQSQNKNQLEIWMYNLVRPSPLSAGTPLRYVWRIECGAGYEENIDKSRKAQGTRQQDMGIEPGQRKIPDILVPFSLPLSPYSSTQQKLILNYKFYILHYNVSSAPPRWVLFTAKTPPGLRRGRQRAQSFNKW